jgi:hypothetical protein
MMQKQTILQYHESQIENTKIIRTRYDISDYLIRDSGINFLEIGTGSGDFAEKICSKVKVNKLTILDTFEGYNDYLDRHGPSPEDQERFVYERFSHISNFKLVKGDSKTELCNLYRSDQITKYDFIYIDANHSFENVMNDIFWATMLISPDGIIGIDDYCFRPENFPKHDNYEVQEAVSAFLDSNHLWKIKYFSFNARGFQNVFISRDYGKQA